MKGIPPAWIVQGNRKVAAMTHGSPHIFQIALAAARTPRARAAEAPALRFLLQIEAAWVLLLGAAALCCHTKQNRNAQLTKPGLQLHI